MHAIVIGFAVIAVKGERHRVRVRVRAKVRAKVRVELGLAREHASETLAGFDAPKTLAQLPWSTTPVATPLHPHDLET